jgi:NAD(P) transhydrogenase subunit alpha
MSELTVGVVRQDDAGERRVALVPESVARLAALGLGTVVQEGAGAAAWFPDAEYAAAGATVLPGQALYERADVVVCVHPPEGAPLRAGQLLLGLLQPLLQPALARRLAEAKVSAVSLDGLPRTLSRAQSMDALTSQANVAGYKAAVLAADLYGGYFPMLMTAAGTVRPASVLVLGAGGGGPAGDRHRPPARRRRHRLRRARGRPGRHRLHRRERARPRHRGDRRGRVCPRAHGRGGGRPAGRDGRRGGPVRRGDHHRAGAGRTPPVLVTAEALAAMRPGSVVVDLAASDLGGNVVGSAPERTLVTDAGVTVVGAGNLAAAVPRAASTAYARNVVALLSHLVADGRIVFDPADEITAGVLVTHDGEVVHPAVRELLNGDPA